VKTFLIQYLICHPRAAARWQREEEEEDEEEEEEDGSTDCER